MKPETKKIVSVRFDQFYRGHVRDRFEFWKCVPLDYEVD